MLSLNGPLRRRGGVSCWVVSLFPVVMLGLSVSESRAQTVYRGTDIGGIQTGRSYYSPSDFESFDTKTGNVVLTFTDLVLPGYAGQDLIFQRTYNNQALPGFSGPAQGKWTFGFAGMVMRVVDPDWNGTSWQSRPQSELGTFEGRLAHTPVFYMADGSRRNTMYENFNSLLQQKVVSADPFQFDRTPGDSNLRHLYMPDGVVCDYDANGWLVHFVDPYGNHVWLNRDVSDHITITQAMGTEVRVVEEVLNGYNWPISMTYAGRTWSYAYDGNHMDVSPPVGPGWHFEWDALGTLSSITTPLGGSISYTYEDQSYSSFTMRVLSYRWMWPGAPFQGSPLAQWHFDLHPGYAANDPLADRTLITTPSHAVYRYEHFSGDPGPKTLGPGTGPLTQTIERESDAYWLDRVDTTYALAQFMGSPLNGGSALPIVVTTRHREFDSTAERATTSYISYPCTAHCYRVPYTITQTFSDAPTRITDRTFWGVPLGTPSLVIGMGRVKTETVTVNDEVVSYLERTYSHPTWLRYNTETVNGVTTTFTPQALGNVQTATTNGKTTTYTYEWGQVKTITGGEPNSEVNRSIRTDGRIESETVGGRTTHYDYDAIGRVTWIEPPGPSGGTVATTIDYTDPHHVVTARGSRSSTTDLDAFGNAIRTADDNTHVQTRMEYDPEGRVIYQSYPYTPGAASGGQDLGFHVEYDVLGRAFRTCQPDPDEGQSGDLCAQTTFSLGSTLSVDETGRSTRSFFTRHGVDELWDPLGHIWQYHYNAGDQLESITGPIGLPESATRTWSYDLATGRMLSETSPEAGTVTYQTEDAYNAAGQVEHKIDANGTDIRYTYDNNHRLATITASNASAGTSVQTVIGYESGASDLVHTTTATDSAQTGSIVTTIDYDEAGRPWRRTDAIDSKSFVTTFAYDELDNLKEIGYASGRHVRYVYDTAGRLTRVYNLETGQNYATNFVYHGSGALSGFTSGNGLVTTLEYEPKRYRLKTIDLNAGSLLHFEYAYYADGNVHELTEGTGTNAITRSFTYDDLDRLTSATASDPTKYPTTLYAFDAHGNRVQADSGQLPYHYYPAPNSFRLQSIGDLDPVHPTPFEYDNNGNLTTGPLTGGTGTFTYTYRPDNLMTRAVTSSGTSDFVYDGGGLRIKRVNGTGTAYFLKGPDSRLLSEWTPGSGTDVTAHDYIYAGGQLIGVATKTFQLGQ